VPNKYGLEWNDAVAADAVQRTRPGTGYLTKEYESTLRHLTLQIAKKDPGFVLRNFWTKARVIVADAVSRFWPAFILLPVALLVGARRRSIRVALLVAIPAGLLGALAPLLTIPDVSYELAWLGTWGALFILAVGSLWVSVRAVVTDLPPELAPLRERPDRDAFVALRERLVRLPATWVLVAALAVTLVLATAARPAAEPGQSSPDPSQSMFVDSSQLNRPAVQYSRFAGSLPQGWTTLAPTFLQRDTGGSTQTGLYMRSPVATQEDLIAGPSVDLPAGTYDLVTTGRAFVGGFQISIRAQDGAPIATSAYSSQQVWDFLKQSMSLPFTLPAPTRVHAVVSSWSGFPDASAWVLWKMKLLAAPKH
jgi:hypothetical protein